jgi:predicted ATPase
MAKAIVHEIVLTPLSHADVNQLVGDALRYSLAPSKRLLYAPGRVVLAPL